VLGDERFDRPQDFGLGVYWVPYLDDFQARCHIGTATVRLSPRERRRLLGNVALAVVRAFGSTTTAGGDDGWGEAAIPAECTEHTCCELLRLGGDAEVVARAGLRQAVAATAAILARAYENKGPGGAQVVRDAGGSLGNDEPPGP